MKRIFYTILVLSFLSSIFLSCKNPILIEATSLYQVSFVTNGGTKIEPIRTKNLITPPETQKEGLILSGWYTTSNFEGASISFPYPIDEDTVLYAKWTKYYNVYFKTNGGTSIKSYATDNIKLSPISTKKGFYLEGWYETSTFNEDKITFPYNVTKDIILYAKWIENPNTNFKVEHYKQNANLDLNLDSYILSYTEILSGKVDTETKATEKEFEGFYPKKIFQTKILLDKTSVAKIYYDRKKCIVSFDSNGGSGKMNSQEFYYQVNQTLDINNFVRYGYYFMGWTLSPNGEVCYSDGDKIFVNKDTVLYAKWKSGITVTKYTAKYLNLSLLSEDCTIKVVGEITDSTIETLAEKIKDSPVDISLDLSEIKNLTIVKATSNSTSFFSNCTEIKSITLPNTVTAIESYAFYDCSFSNIYIPNSVKTIGNYAFYSCDNLTSIDLDSVETIGVNAFANNNLTTINLKNIHTIGNYAFAYSNNLNEIYIDAVLINSLAFTQSPNLQSAIIGKNVIEIQSYIFENCSKLKYVTFEDPKNWYYKRNNYTYSEDVSDASDNAISLKYSSIIMFKK